VTTKAATDRRNSTRISIVRDSAMATTADTVREDIDNPPSRLRRFGETDIARREKRSLALTGHWQLRQPQKPTHPIQKTGGCVGYRLTDSGRARSVEFHPSRRRRNPHLFDRVRMSSCEPSKQIRANFENDRIAASEHRRGPRIPRQERHFTEVPPGFNRRHLSALRFEHH